MEERRELHTLLDYLETLSKQDLKRNVYKAIVEFSFLALQENIHKLKDRHGDLLFKKKDSQMIQDVLKGKNDFQPMKKEYLKIYEYIANIHTNINITSRDFNSIQYMNNKNIQFTIPLTIPGHIIMTPRDQLHSTICIIIEAIRLTYSVSPLSSDMTRHTIRLILGLISILNGETKQGILSIVTFIYEAPMLYDLYKKVISHIVDLMESDLSQKYTPANLLVWGFVHFAPETDLILARDFINSLSEYSDKDVFTSNDLEILENSTIFPENLPVVHLIMKLMRNQAIV
jgi:hypothetical protein